MKKIVSAIVLASFALGGASASAATRQEKAQARLEKMLEGRTAGEPVKCITMMRINDLEVLHKTAIVYRSGDTIYVARVARPEVLDSSDIMVLERLGSQLCNTDIIRMVDQGGHFITGVVFIDEFVPYKKAG